MRQALTLVNRLGGLWLLVGLAAVLVLPWYKLPPPDTGGGASLLGSALTEALAGRWWLLPPVLAMLAFAGLRLGRGERWPAHAAVPWLAGAAAILYLGQAFGIGLRGPAIDGIAQAMPAAALGQPGLGVGGFALGIALTGIIADSLAMRGFCRGERFAANAVIFVITLLTLFVFFPILRLGSAALFTPDGVFQPGLFVTRFTAPDLWGLDCLVGDRKCGVVINTLILGILSGLCSTALGLALALIVARTGFRFKGALRAISILPIITPPFVVGVAIIVLFGRTGVVTGWLDLLFDIPRTRWVYGLPGILLAQVLAFAPITFLVLLGTVEAINPTLEEASKTLGAKPFATFRTVTWPLLRPGLAAAFLLAFIESLADFGNPIVLGGGYDVLSIRIFFAVVGARYDLGNAAVLAIILLTLTLSAFWLQTRWLGKKSYVTVTGKSDAGLSAPLPDPLKAAVYLAVIPWILFTLGVYAIVVIGGFVTDVARFDLAPTLRHLSTAFAFEFGQFGLQLYGSAWDSLQTTVLVSAIAAPLTTAIGILTAYLIARQNFAGKGAFEFGTMLSFAIPGTVVGVSYVAAFNVPPVDITGTMAILVICFMFRNMPVGMRAGIAALSQIDRSMEEASQTMGANGFATLRTVVLPLIRPAIFTSMVYAFVTAMTAVSAVIFLVSARHNMATAYIMGRVENGEYPLAIAYSAVLMIIMIVCIAIIQLLVGRRQLGRRSEMHKPPAALPAE
ncbi:ABC transporter permease [Pelagibacterium lacus]|uniref:Iron ABC transporter permease n=1 Tax=Pelagibacterium lacus TaxID=2282655 RepID=A0A369W1D7_9HYPH|nr:iron ABC transporter permease [Pelagibacterium lacus]RDE08348.1 iron ABC transporter permease [Pelagibacterium lacus]